RWAPHGSLWTPGRDRDGRGAHGGRIAAGPTGAPGMAPLRHAGRARRGWHQLSGLYEAIALPPELVCPPARPGHERGLLWGRRGLDPHAALAADPDRARWLARRLLDTGAPGAGAAGTTQPAAEAATRGSRTQA